MLFQFYHPDYPQYAWYNLSLTAQLESTINRFGPMKYLTGTFDWPKWFSGFRGWTDSINSLWWPQGGDNFATLVVVVDETRRQLLTQCVELQQAPQSTNAKSWPYLILAASLDVGESLPAVGITSAVTTATTLLEWKLYPLAPINLTALSGDATHGGLWLVPFVDVRYFQRNIALNGYVGPTGTTTEEFTTSGVYSWECPAGVTSVTVEAWGGGGNSGSSGFTGGGGGGAYARSILTVTPSTVYEIVVAEPNNSVMSLGSHFDSAGTLFAESGYATTNPIGGSGGQAAACVGDITFSGGSGGSASPFAGGGGGSSAGSDSDGNVGANGTFTGGAGGAAVTDGGAGGNAGSAGSAPGGGAGGFNGGGGSTIVGASGKVKLTYTYSQTTNYPILDIDPTDTDPVWMPDLLWYPQDLVPPPSFVAIDNAYIHPNINPSMRWGEAVDLQARVLGERIVCRDVRSNYNATGGNPNHTEFTGVLSDYPEESDENYGYHTDALILHTLDGAARAGGECDLTDLDELTARKVQVVFQCRGDDAFYSVCVYPTTMFPATVSDLSIDTVGPNLTDQKYVPVAALTVQASQRYPANSEVTELQTAAKQWVLLYYNWRAKQAYLKYPAIYPVIPNGHARAIRWDFSTLRFETTYVALEGVQGTDDAFVIQKEPFYARIDGEGSIDDNLQGFYAWTELEDVDGELTVLATNPRQGFVAGVNDETETFNPARDEAGKVAVPIGLTVLLVPGKPYLDVTSDLIFTPYRFTTTDLDQVVRIKDPVEINADGYYGGYIQRWDPELKRFVDSEEIWVVVLE